jgi:hypothetical protein
MEATHKFTEIQQTIILNAVKNFLYCEDAYSAAQFVNHHIIGYISDQEELEQPIEKDEIIRLLYRASSISDLFFEIQKALSFKDIQTA